MKSADAAARLALIIVAAVALAGCGRKKEAAPEAAAAVEAPAAVAEEKAPAIDHAAGAAHGADMTKASSQGAASAIAANVFARALEGDPEATFLARCQYCHVALGPGTITLSKRLGPEHGMLADRTDLSKDYVKAVVRNGLNTMPAITRVEVSDDELERIADYLTRNNPQE